MNLLGWAGCLLFAANVYSTSFISTGRPVRLRRIQAFQDGQLLPDSAYRLTSISKNGTKEKPVAAGLVFISDYTDWIIRRGNSEYRFRDVLECVQYASTYDIRLEFRSKANPLECLDLSYYSRKGEEVSKVVDTMSSGHETHTTWHPTCDVLFFIPAPKGAIR